MGFEQLNELKESRITQTSVGLMTGPSELFGEDVLLVGLNQMKVYIPRSEMSTRSLKRSLIHYIGKNIQYQIKEVRESEGYAIGSVKLIQEQQIESFIQRVNDGELIDFDAEIVGLVEYGAFLEFEGVRLSLANIHFANDRTRVEDLYKIGDTLKVRVLKINDSKISVEAVEKYQAKAYLPFAEFIPGDIVEGVVRTVNGNVAYVHLMTSIDGMAALKEWLPVEKGDRVRFRVNQVREDGKIRGRILKNLTSTPESDEDIEKELK